MVSSAPASVCFHRALIRLMPAATLSIVVYRSDFNARGWLALIALAAVVAWGSGVYWLWRGSRQLQQEQEQEQRGRG